MTGAALLALLALRPQLAAGQVQEPVYTSAAEVDSALKRLDEERDRAAKAVGEEFQTRRKAMMGSEDWPLATSRERRERLKALKDELEDSERRLREEYQAKRDELRRLRKDLVDGVRP